MPVESTTRCSGSDLRRRYTKRLPAPAQGRVAGHGQRELEQSDDREEQASRSSQRQAVDLGERRHRQDGRRGVGARAAAPPRPLVLMPRPQNVFADPERQASAPDEGSVIFAPVTEAVRVLTSLLCHTPKIQAPPPP